MYLFIKELHLVAKVLKRVIGIQKFSLVYQFLHQVLYWETLPLDKMQKWLQEVLF